MLLVRQAAAGEAPAWGLPGGEVADDELVTEGLAREVLEETGLRILDPLRLAFVVQVDNRRPVQLYESRGPGRGYLVTAWTFEVTEWQGELAPADPDGFVSEAVFVPRDDAIARLEPLWWHGLTIRHLRGELEPGSLWLQRVHPDGRMETLASVVP